MIETVCRYIEAHADEPLTLQTLSGVAGLSPFHLQRRFKAAVGLSPKQYAEAVRLRALKAALRARHSVTDAVYAAGFGSPSRVYERAASRLGMTPGRYRDGGRGVSVSYAVAPTPLGTLLVAATDRGLCAVELGGDAADLRRRLEAEYPQAVIAPMRARGDGQLEAWMGALGAHLEHGGRAPALPLDIVGTSFQMRVWRYLQRIPPGQTRSYAEVARAIGRPTAARAVARACAQNRVAILIPCHRVIRGDGALGGYRWGLSRKRALLARERR